MSCVSEYDSGWSVLRVCVCACANRVCFSVSVMTAQRRRVWVGWTGWVVGSRAMPGIPGARGQGLAHAHTHARVHSHTHTPHGKGTNSRKAAVGLAREGEGGVREVIKERERLGRPLRKGSGKAS